MSAPAPPITALAPACVFAETVSAPWAHPIWSCYQISVAHLRETEGAPAPDKRFEEATHELAVCALSPDDERRILAPANHVIQFTFPDDARAAAFGAEVARRISVKQVNPDTDYQRPVAEFLERLAITEFGASRAEACWADPREALARQIITAKERLH